VKLVDTGLKGSSVVITGGASNIGRAIVHAFAEEQANITLGDINLEQAEKVAAEARARGAAAIQVIRTDVTRMDDVKALFSAAETQFGTVDVLVNGVGWSSPLFFAETTPEFWQKVININYVSALNCTKAALDIMIPRKKGAIVAIGSDASRQGEAQHAVYGGIKGAINSLMKSVARENGRFGIRCNVVCPGITPPDADEAVGKTSMWSADSAKQWDQSVYDKIASGIPLKRLGHARDTANAVVFLASDKLASYVTGQVLSVSGGFSMA